jgi:peptidoglycan/LPS O-acetylase OafA/YrhL
MVLHVFGWGHFAVSVFIVVSGFCLMAPVLRNGGILVGGWRLFMRRRAIRILPPYYVALVLSLLLITSVIGRKTGTHWDSTLPVTAQGIVAHMFLLQDIYGAPQINYVFWSIALEWQIYFFFPLLILSWRYWGLWRTASLGILVSVAAVTVSRRFTFAMVEPQFLGLFTLGMLGAALAFGADTGGQKWFEKRFWPALAVLCMVLASLWTYLGRTWIADYFVGTVTMIVLLLTSHSTKGGLHRLLSTRPLAKIGRFSYSIYLIHAPLLQIFCAYLLQPFHVSGMRGFLLLAILGSPAIVGCSYLFYLAFERPFVGRLRHIAT